MLRGISTAAGGMLSQGISSDVLADNLANINTVGFKKTSMSFQDFSSVMVNATLADKKTELGKYSLSVKPQDTRILFDQGTLAETGNPYHVALEGDGFFEVTMDNGKTAFTRDGRFQTNEAGYLVTLNGEKINTDQGFIQIPKNTSSVVISQTGDVKVKAIGQNALQSLGKIKIVQFQNNNTMTKLGQSLYDSNGQEPARDIKNVQVIQGVLEQSNVNPVRELVDSMMGLRTYEMLQKTINMQNDTFGKAVNEVGRLG